MATEMASAALTSSEAAATMPADCPTHMQSGAAASDFGEHQAPADMAGCGSCELCLPIAETAKADVDVAAPARHALPPGGSSEFLSAFVALDLKPPTL